jgi:hypothetical protein
LRLRLNAASLDQTADAASQATHGAGLPQSGGIERLLGTVELSEVSEPSFAQKSTVIEVFAVQLMHDRVGRSVTSKFETVASHLCVLRYV